MEFLNAAGVKVTIDVALSFCLVQLFPHRANLLLQLQAPTNSLLHAASTFQRALLA
ncbi:hypothetical protein ACU4GD_26345 [Cupriavidus basilensis]